MGEWQGPWKCEKCGWQIENDSIWLSAKVHSENGNYDIKAANPCTGTFLPHDRRRPASGVIEAIAALEGEIRWQDGCADGWEGSLTFQGKPIAQEHRLRAEKMRVALAALREGGPK